MILEINVTAPDRPIYMFFFLFDLKITEKKLFKEKDQYLKLYRYTWKKNEENKHIYCVLKSEFADQLSNAVHIALQS